MGLLDTTGSITKELIGSNWSPFRHYSGGKWYVDIRVTAPHCGGATDDADIEISQLKLELKINSETQLSRSRVNFGKLYFPKYESGGTVNSGALNDTAVDYNEKQEQQIKIKNVGYGNLNWSVKSKPSGLTISPSSGSVARNSEQTITLKLESPGGTDSDYSKEVVLETDDGNPDNDKFTIQATLYDTPKIQHIPPEVGWKNNIVHVAVDDSEARFEVSEADPFFPKPGGGKPPVKRHEWQSTGQGASPTAVYDITYEVKLTTAEGFVLTDTDSTTVTIDAEMPTAYPGGPYRGGIAGGNFSPIQFSGNHPDFVESEDIGHIVDWVWSFEGAGGASKALWFNGTDSSVTIQGFSGVIGIGPRTVAAWIITTERGDFPIVSWGENQPGQKWVFRVQTTDGTPGAIRVEVNGGYVVGSTDVTDGVWHHVAAVLPEKTSPNATDIQLYVDGKLEDTSASKAREIDTSPNGTVEIGTDVNDRFYAGRIDEVAIWDRALTEDEIGYLLPFGPLGRPSGLAGYWSFNEGGGATVYDLSPSGNQGSVTSCLWRAGKAGTTGKTVAGIWNPTQVYARAGTYEASLIVQSHRGRWSPISTTTVTGQLP